MGIESFILATIATTITGTVIGGGVGCLNGCTVTCCNPAGGAAGGFCGAAIGGTIGFFTPTAIYAVVLVAKTFFRACSSIGSGLKNTLGSTGKNIYAVAQKHPILAVIAVLTIIVLLRRTRRRQTPILE